MALLEFNPSSVLVFIVEPFVTSSTTLEIRNITDSHIVYKLKTNNPSGYLVKPSMGLLRPHETRTLDIMAHAYSEMPPECNDRFLIKACICDPIDPLDKDALSSALEDKERGSQQARFDVEMRPREETPADNKPGSTNDYTFKKPSNDSADSERLAIAMADLEKARATITRLQDGAARALATQTGALSFVHLLLALILGLILGHYL